MKNSLFLYWFRDKPNVGDAASNLVVKYYSGRKIKYKKPFMPLSFGIRHFLHLFLSCFKIEWLYVSPFDKCLMAIGSILDYSNDKCIIWGSGFREYDSIYKGGKVLAVRGYLSRKKLPNIYSNVAIGDPAILLPLIFTRKPLLKNLKEPRLAIIPHYCDIDEIMKLYSSQYDILDVRTNNVYDFICRIWNYDYILSSSLHGIIIAHSYGIPAIWIQKGYINSGLFKFHDYFSSVNIPLYDGFRDIEKILKNKNTWILFFDTHKCISLPKTDISTIQKNLIEAFPYKNDRKI